MTLGLDYKSAKGKLAAFLQDNRSEEGFMSINWKKLLGLNPVIVFGLDIGSSAVKAVQLAKNGTGFDVTAAGIVDITGTQNVAEAIKQCLRSANIESPYAVCGICGPDVAVRHFNFPKLSDEELEGAVRLEAETVCPFNVNDSAVDHQITKTDKTRIAGVLVAATNNLIREKQQLVEQAGIDTVLMDVNGLALLNCYQQCKTSHDAKTTAILNIDNSYTNLAIVSEDCLPFVRDISCGADQIVRDIAASNDVPTEAVDKWLSDKESDTRLRETLAAACKKLIEGINDTLRYYTAQKKSKIDQMLVCGKPALLSSFVGLLNERVSPEVVFWNPFEKIQIDPQADCKEFLSKRGSELAVAAGLAMRLV